MMKNENGRSMVEMLGVLAIIGVLSVGGIAGYTMAMNKYRANEIAAEAAQCGMLAIAKKSINSSYNQTNCTDVMTLSTKGYTGMTFAFDATNGDKVTVTVNGATGGVKDALNALSGSNLGNFVLAVGNAS